jgi:hypothetical protein
MKINLIYLLLGLILISCEKSELEGITLNNPLSSESGIEIFIIDSVKTDNAPSVTYYFKINYNLIKDTSQINNVIVYRNDVLRSNLSPSQRTWLIDINVNKGTTYVYRLGLICKNGDMSKLSLPYSIKIP